MTTLMSEPLKQNPVGYRMGALVLLIALGTIVLALLFEHLGGFIPCPLCLQQRYAYYAAIPAAFVGLILLSSGKGRWAALFFFLIALAFLANAGLGVYQAGAEWKFWPGPATCSGNLGLTLDAGNLIEELEKTRVVRCDEAAWRFAGLSFAGWNVLISLFLFGASISAAASSSRQS
ncbi:MAG: disulfide bond formation protein B [Hyphomicrobiaceae bacterium]